MSYALLRKRKETSCLSAKLVDVLCRQVEGLTFGLGCLRSEPHGHMAVHITSFLCVRAAFVISGHGSIFGCAGSLCDWNLL